MARTTGNLSNLSKYFGNEDKARELLEALRWPNGAACGKVLELTQNSRAKNGKPWQKLHQFLSEIGVKALRNHNGQLLGVARIAKDRVEYESYVQRLFGEQPGLFDLEND